MGACVGQFAWIIRMRRALVLSNLKQAFPEKTNDELVVIGAQSARNFGRTMVEFIRFDGNDRFRLDQLIEIEGSEAVKSATKSGKGCVVTTGHFGAWALYFTALAAKDIPISLLVGKQKNAKVDNFIHSISGDAVTLIPKGRSAVKKIIKSLAKGHCIVIVADQHAGSRGVLSDFLGRITPTLSLPGAFVAKNRIPIFTMTGHRVANGSHEVSIQPLDIDLSADKDHIKQSVADTYNRVLGQAVLKHPEQYFWYHRKWRDVDAKIDGYQKACERLKEKLN